MNQEESSTTPRILVAPLDWGLGHATRCIPLINNLLNANCTVFLAGDGRIRSLLQQEFPDLPFLDLKGYDITYSRTRWTLPFTIAAQIPKILSTIDEEQVWLQQVVEAYSIDAVISDNRYGLYHPEIPCIFMSHQLLIKTGLGKLADGILQQLNYDYINRFTECWIPDTEESFSLAGTLSHPEEWPQVPVRYTGPLSRFQAIPGIVEEKQLLILISGPEPQRTILEDLLLEQITTYPEPVEMVRGLPEHSEPLQVQANVQAYNHLGAKELNEKINRAGLVISRCGYSTIMDLAVLKKKSILIPTPGQTEQEYLATHLMKHNFALCIDQDKFYLKNAIEWANSFNYVLPDINSSNQLDAAVHSLLSLLRPDLEPQRHKDTEEHGEIFSPPRG